MDVFGHSFPVDTGWKEVEGMTSDHTAGQRSVANCLPSAYHFDLVDFDMS